MDFFSEKYESAVQNIAVSENNIFALLSISAVLIFISFIIIFLITLKSGLVKETEEIVQNEKADLKRGLKTGKKVFWRIFSLEIILSFLSYFVYFSLSKPLNLLYSQKAWLPFISLLIFAAAIFIPFFFLAAFIQIFAFREIIFNNNSLFKSIFLAYNLFSDEWKKSSKALIIFLAFSFAAAFIVSIILIMFLIPLIIISFAIYILLSKTPAASIGFVLTGSIVLAALIFIGNIFIVFRETFWTIFYKKINKGK